MRDRASRRGGMLDATWQRAICRLRTTSRPRRRPLQRRLIARLRSRVFKRGNFTVLNSGYAMLSHRSSCVCSGEQARLPHGSSGATRDCPAVRQRVGRALTKSSRKDESFAKLQKDNQVETQARPRCQATIQQRVPAMR